MFRKMTVTALAIVAAAYSLVAQNIAPQAYKGWPSRSGEIDIREGFANPPAGYGNVPFYWWTGDPLDMKRLEEQLEILSDASTDGLCISYNHTHAKVDTVLNAQGHGFCGRVSGGEPRVLSEEWYRIWNEFSAKCAGKGIGLGMDDYVVAWPKNGEFIDSILAQPSYRRHPGLLKKVTVAAGTETPENTLLVTGKGDSLEVIYAAPSPELHPDYGRDVVRWYLQPFEDHMDEAGRAGMNYFFQDELDYNPSILSWCEDMRQIFLDRKGYDIVPHLPALFASKDSEVTPEDALVRLDYAEVVTELAEERYFKPVYDWSAERGLIYGCDNIGRGLKPTQYMDYFRAVSWFTAPGNDAPARGSSFTQTKVSSSISHLYGRPRAWLEAFHSMGWDANGGVLTRQLDHHIIAGGNLLCMHGLYYSTHGGWWEWAPPCFHFHMPYWEHMKSWLKYAERMCFVLSQGVHVCDVAVLYPTETMQAYPEAKPELTFKVSSALSWHGVDYDFIDYNSLRNAAVGDGVLSVSDENYKILFIADARAMHPETLAKIQEFQRCGGIVLSAGRCIDGITPAESVDAEDENAVVNAVRSRIVADFAVSTGVGKVLHRRVADKDVYMIMDVENGASMTFRSVGKVECWDAMHGTVSELKVDSILYGCTTLTYNGADGNSMLLVFSPGVPDIVLAESGKNHVARTNIPVVGDWDIEIVPTMNNKWGDYRLPADDGFIGVEAREMEYAVADAGHMNARRAFKKATARKAWYGYGPYMKTAEADPSRDVESLLGNGLDTLHWRPYEFSWQYGVADSPGSQGYHGLKCKVDDRFLILDKGAHQLFRTDVYADMDGEYSIVRMGVAPYRILLDGRAVSGDKVKLGKGWHDLIIVYPSTRKTAYSLEGMRGTSIDYRDRSMVVLYPEGSSGPAERGMYGDIVASSWYGTGHAVYGDKTAEGYFYRFQTAPGTVSMNFAVNGTVEGVWIDGKPLPDGDLSRTGTEASVNTYALALARWNPSVSTVVVYGVPSPGYEGPAFFAGPVTMECNGGKLKTGDWSDAGAMKFFSGGVRYSKNVRIGNISGKVMLDLGDVDATCEVAVNGRKVDVLLSSPYMLDVTDFVKSGDNLVEVLVYSTLSNHYVTIPSPYKGTPRAGLIGPVKFVVEH